MLRTRHGRSIAKILRLALSAEQKNLGFQEGCAHYEHWLNEQAIALRSRRELIKGSVKTLAGASLALAGCKTPQGGQLSANESLEDSDIAIVGGGLGGLTCAYRLWQVGIAANLYEAAGRLGGRVYTARNFNADGQFCELGAELVDSTNEELIELAKDLGLVPEGYGELDPVEGESELFFYGNQVYTGKDFYTALRPLLASVSEDLRRIFPNGEVYWPNFQTKNSAIVIRYDHMPLDEYFATKAKTTERWVLAALSHAYETEYGGALSRQSALNFICLVDTNLSDGFSWYGASDEWGRVKGGNQGLIDKMQEQLEGQIPVALDHELVAVSHNGSQFKLVFNVKGKTKEVRASTLVCGLPFSVLRQVEGLDKLELAPVKLRAIRELAYGTNAKFMSSYKTRLWRQKGSKLPASQAAIITDLKGGQYWETSRIQAGDSGIITNFLGGLDGARVTESHLATILSDLDTLWPGLKAQHDGKARLMAWTRERYARGAYSSPAPGQYTSIIGCEGLPDLNDKFFFVGEHASEDWRGYMNGAIQTGNHVAYRLAGKTRSQVTLSQQSGLSLTGPGVPIRRRKWRRLP